MEGIFPYMYFCFTKGITTHSSNNCLTSTFFQKMSIFQEKWYIASTYFLTGFISDWKSCFQFKYHIYFFTMKYYLRILPTKGCFLSLSTLPLYCKCINEELLWRNISVMLSFFTSFTFWCLVQIPSQSKICLLGFDDWRTLLTNFDQYILAVNA